jgi:toxin YoeB
MIYEVDYTKEAREDIAELKRSEPQAYKKLQDLILELFDHPKTGIGHPKQLGGNRSGQWSRRIDKKHRLIYRIDDDIVLVLILSAMGHYDDK